jgi:hypothetical protein
MENVVSRTMATISSVCGMEAADRTGVLSPHHRSLYPSKQDSFFERILAAQFLLHHAAISAADCILKNGKHAAIDPLGLLAGLYDVLKVEIELSALEFEEDENDRTSIFYIATDQAIASANILLVQLRELLVAHGDGLYKLVNEPLKSLLSKDGMRDLKEFAAASEVPYSQYGKIVQPSSGSKRNWFPKPVTAIGDGRLARLALLAGARPTNNNSVESRWSLLTNRFHGMVRNSRAQYMSAIFRKQDHVKSNLRRLMGSEEFLKIFQDSRKFMRRNKDSYKAIFEDNTEETQRKLSATIKPKEKYKNSNIGTLPDKEEQIPCKEKGQKNPKPKRKREGRMKRYEESGSDESSESAPSVHDKQSSDSDASSNDHSLEADSDSDVGASSMSESGSPQYENPHFDDVDQIDEDQRSCGSSGADGNSGASAAAAVNDGRSQGASGSERNLESSADMEQTRALSQIPPCSEADRAPTILHENRAASKMKTAVIQTWRMDILKRKRTTRTTVKTLVTPSRILWC